MREGLDRITRAVDDLTTPQEREDMMKSLRNRLGLEKPEEITQKPKSVEDMLTEELHKRLDPIEEAAVHRIIRYVFNTQPLKSTILELVLQEIQKPRARQIVPELVSKPEPVITNPTLIELDQVLKDGAYPLANRQLFERTIKLMTESFVQASKT